MPHLRFRAVEETVVRDLSETLRDALSFALNCPPDYFTFEHVKTDFFYGGAAVQGPSTVEVHWFERPQEMQDLSAQMIHEALAAKGCGETIVIFTTLHKTTYYENGQHY